MIFLWIALITIYLHSISAIQCPACDEINFDISNASLSLNQSYCEVTIQSAAQCRSELFIDLIDPYQAILKYFTVPHNALVTSNGESVLSTSIMFSLDVKYSDGVIIYDCYDKDLCNNNDDIIRKQYKQLSELNSTALKNELIDLLYNNQTNLQDQQIECYNQNNKIDKCHINGHCQMSLIIERGRSDSLTTTCIPNREPGSKTGLIISSKSIGNDYKRTSISYICNKNKCNDPAIARQIRQIFSKVNLVDSKATNNHSTFLLIVLSIICIIINQ